MRVVFIGASNFGLRCLEVAASLPCVELVGVVTAPRSFCISYSKGKNVTNVLHADFETTCQRLRIPLVQLREKMTDDFLLEALRCWAPDFILVVGWYHMIPRVVLNSTPKGVAGIHASLLPRYRGGAPLVWAIIQGEQEVGASLFYFDDGVDSGDIISQIAVPIGFSDTIATVYKKIEEVSLDMLKKILPQIADGTAPRCIQAQLPEGHPEFWPQRSPDDGLINWSNPALNIYNFVRAQTRPYPGAFSFFKGKRLTVWECEIYETPNVEYIGRPGEVLAIMDSAELLKGILVATVDRHSHLLLTEIECSDSTGNGLLLAKRLGIRIGDYLDG
ncbi:MAG: methionyl-tRNA formyltransferase [Nitrospirota bacterium]|nr:methionyl-tRNA formyltransferase [Nitrospirota bacterium]